MKNWKKNCSKKKLIDKTQSTTYLRLRPIISILRFWFPLSQNTSGFEFYRRPASCDAPWRRQRCLLGRCPRSTRFTGTWEPTFLILAWSLNYWQKWTKIDRLYIFSNITRKNSVFCRIFRKCFRPTNIRGKKAKYSRKNGWNSEKMVKIRKKYEIAPEIFAKKEFHDNNSRKNET